MAGGQRPERKRPVPVRASGAPGIPGKWQDAATGEHGDLLDIIKLTQNLPDLSGAMREAAWFLGASPPLLPFTWRPAPLSEAERIGAARRLFAVAGPLAGTLGEKYLKRRGIVLKDCHRSLRFLPDAWFDRHTRRPALIAGVRDNTGTLTGVARYFLDAHGRLIERRALGRLNGHAVRFDPPGCAGTPENLLVGEGLESTLPFAVPGPGFAFAATLSTAHMAAFIIPPNTHRLVIAADKGFAGEHAALRLLGRATAQNVATEIILPRLKDFNDDWLAFGGGDAPLLSDAGFTAPLSERERQEGMGWF